MPSNRREVAERINRNRLEHRGLRRVMAGLGDAASRWDLGLHLSREDLDGIHRTTVERTRDTLWSADDVRHWWGHTMPWRITFPIARVHDETVAVTLELDPANFTIELASPGPLWRVSCVVDVAGTAYHYSCYVQPPTTLRYRENVDTLPTTATPQYIRTQPLTTPGNDAARFRGGFGRDDNGQPTTTYIPTTPRRTTEARANRHLPEDYNVTVQWTTTNDLPL